MATVRITGNWRNPNREEWAGAPAVDEAGHIDRSVSLPEEAYLAIERGIRRGGIEGTVQLSTGAHLNWFLDRDWGGSTAKPEAKSDSQPPRLAGTFRAVLLPADLTDRHNRAVEVAARLAIQGGGEVTLLHVIELIEGMPPDEDPEFYQQLQAKAEAHLGRLLGRLREWGASGRVVVLHGHCVREVVGYAARSGTDLIVVTAQPLGPSTGFSKSHQIAYLAQCPVLLVK